MYVHSLYLICGGPSGNFFAMNLNDQSILYSHGLNHSGKITNIILLNNYILTTGLDG